MIQVAEVCKEYKRAALNSKQWPKTVKCRFIEPGLVHYEDMGTVLIQRPALNKMAQSFVGKPVIDEKHADAKPENFLEIADGVVIRVWTDPNDGWDWCEFLVWDEDTLKHCQSREYSVSCAYTPTEVNQVGGKHNNIDYDGEFLNGVYTHLAIVKDPRYEKAKIVMNSKGGAMFNLFRKKEESVELDGSTELDIGGSRVKLADAVNAYVAENSRNMKDDDVIKVNGKEVSVKDLKNAYIRENARKNAKHDHPEAEDCGPSCKASRKNKGEEGEEAGDQDEAVKKEKKEGKELESSKKNASDDDDKDKKEDKDDKKEAKNSQEEGEEPKGKHLEEFRKAAEMRNADPLAPTINTMTDRIKLGATLYGTKKEA